jgi:hypothetical protein
VHPAIISRSYEKQRSVSPQKISIAGTRYSSATSLPRLRFVTVSTIQATPTNYEIKAVALLGLGFGLLALDRWSIATLFPSISKDLNLNYQDLDNLTGV